MLFFIFLNCLGGGLCNTMRPTLGKNNVIFPNIVVVFKNSSKIHGLKAKCCNRQAISQVRTLYSFVGEQKVVQAYINALQHTLRIGYRSGAVKGLGMGFTMCVLFNCWAILFWYGGVLVKNAEANGGKVLTTILMVVLAGM